MHRRTFLAALGAGLALPAGARAQAQAFAAARAYHDEHGGAALVILRNGVTRAEDVRRGGPQAMSPLGGATTSFLPALAAALVSDGLLTLDEPAALTLLDWAAHPVKSRISLRMLLDRTGGLSGEGRRMSDFEATMLEPVAEPGQGFLDDPAPTQIFTEIARRKLAGAGASSDPADYVRLRVLTPVGCAPISWRRDERNEPSFHDGASVSVMGWARWGELMRRVGVWRAAQLVDGAALRDAARGSWPQPRYGFGLWLAWPSAQRAPALRSSDLWAAAPPVPQDLIMAAGENGARLYILPTQRIVAARFADQTGAWSDAAFVSALLSRN